MGAQPSKPASPGVRARVVAAVLAATQRVAWARSALRALVEARRRRSWRALCRRTAVADRAVVFSAYGGRAYACSPKALYRAMLADPAYDGWEFVWAFKSPERYAALPDFARATLVPYHPAPAFYEALARSRYWITNMIFPTHVTPREGQVLVQTWHGTPLKRLGCDLAAGSSRDALFSAADIHRRYRVEGARFTWLLSPSPYATQKLGSAFDLPGLGKTASVIEEGYPRNDSLFTADADHVARLKSELGIPAGKRVVLYAPTWRDDQHDPSLGYTMRLGIDVDELRAALGDEYVVLCRTHYLVANAFDFERHAGFVIDASAVDDITDLYLVSDVLVTDYSSVFFDYASLKRPIIFFMYDYDTYATELRGFYLDPSELPGPIVRTTAELAAALCAAEAPTAQQIAQLASFSARFAPHDDGHASQRVLARVIGTQGRAGSQVGTPGGGR